MLFLQLEGNEISRIIPGENKAFCGGIPEYGNSKMPFSTVNNTPTFIVSIVHIHFKCKKTVQESVQIHWRSEKHNLKVIFTATSR